MDPLVEHIANIAVVRSTGSRPVPTQKVNLVEKESVDRALPRMTARSARRLIRQKPGSFFGFVDASWVGDSGLVVIAANVLRRCRLSVPRRWIVEEEAG